MPSITSWNRLEPRASGSDLAGLRAVIHDPLWMLARQWQFHEWKGEDRGSAVEVRLATEAAHLSRFRSGAADQAEAYESRLQPLETLVEREPPRVADISLREAARAGLDFLRQLDAQPQLSTLRSRAIAAHGFRNEADELDPISARFHRVVMGRAVDGRHLFSAYQQAFETDPTLAGATLSISVGGADEPVFRALVASWMEAYQSLFAPQERGSCWQPRRMEYGFSVGCHDGTKEVVLAAQEYRGGELDWHSFRLQDDSLGSQPSQRDGSQDHFLLPSLLDFPGMPANRWWEFEDRTVDLGSVSAGAFDLARLLLLEFALVYSNDWLLVPVELEVGSWSRVKSLQVIDSFGELTEIGPVAGNSGDWRMFQISDQQGGAAGRLFLPPVLGGSLQGPPIEEVALLRDEMANYGWAIERRIRTSSGVSVLRAQEHETTSSTPPPAAASLVYRLGSNVAEHWFPLVAEALQPAGRAIHLKLGRIDRGNQPATSPKGRLLGELEQESPSALYEEEVPRAGAIITRAPQFARWIDGSSHAWIGRQKRSGRGEAGSGFRFDVVQQQE